MSLKYASAMRGLYGEYVVQEEVAMSIQRWRIKGEEEKADVCDEKQKEEHEEY